MPPLNRNRALPSIPRRTTAKTVASATLLGGLNFLWVVPVVFMVMFMVSNKYWMHRTGNKTGLIVFYVFLAISVAAGLATWISTSAIYHEGVAVKSSVGKTIEQKGSNKLFKVGNRHTIKERDRIRNIARNRRADKMWEEAAKDRGRRKARRIAREDKLLEGYSG